jgi:homoserine kinase
MHDTIQRVQVKVPATTANLGCGFDSLGLALRLYNTFTLAVTSEPGWYVRLPPGIALTTDSTNLVFRSARRLFEHVGMVPSNLCLTLDIQIPLARGLGSSSSAIIGGLVAANHLTGNTLDRETLLALAIDIEGHPDNVTPALLGGLTLSYSAEGQYRHVLLPCPSALAIVVAIPDFELPTAQARAVLPAQVDRADAVFNSSRTALFVYALYHQRYDLLATAMDDRLHQPYRASLIPGMCAAIAAGYGAKALGVALSGAGPTVMAFALERADAVATALQDAFAQHGIRCRTLVLHADITGASVVAS